MIYQMFIVYLLRARGQVTVNLIAARFSAHQAQLKGKSRGFSKFHDGERWEPAMGQEVVRRRMGSKLTPQG